MLLSYIFFFNFQFQVFYNTVNDKSPKGIQNREETLSSGSNLRNENGSSDVGAQIHNRVKREENNRDILSSLPNLPHSNLRKKDKEQKSYYEIEDEDAYETIPTSDNVINKELNDTKTQITVSQEERVK